MGEGSATPENTQITKPVISDEPVRKTPQSRISKFSRWLRIFGKREKPTRISQLESTKNTEQRPNLIVEGQSSVAEPIIPEKLAVEAEQTEHAIEESAILPSRQEELKVVVENIASILTDKLNKKSDIVPPQVDNRGVAAIGGTNETVSKGFFEAVQTKNTDGYLVGIGVGNVFTLLHCFSEGTPPKGIVLADIDPVVIAVGKLMIKKLRESETFEGFDSQVHGLPEGEFIQEIQEIIREEDNSILAKRLASLSREDWTKAWRYTAKNKDDTSLYKYWNPEQYDGTPYQGTPINVVGAMKEKFSVLKQIADSSNIALVYADFTNPSFIDAVRELPEFSISTNIIYLSNIIDHITGRGYQFRNAGVIESLKVYENSTKPPIFIDTLQSLNYFLRARNTLPVYTQEQLLQPIPKWGLKPHGLIFADKV